jgi:hypothetical protein
MTRRERFRVPSNCKRGTSPVGLSKEAGKRQHNIPVGTKVNGRARKLMLDRIVCAIHRGREKLASEGLGRPSC